MRAGRECGSLWILSGIVRVWWVQPWQWASMQGWLRDKESHGGRGAAAMALGGAPAEHGAAVIAPSGICMPLWRLCCSNHTPRKPVTAPATSSAAAAGMAKRKAEAAEGSRKQQKQQGGGKARQQGEATQAAPPAAAVVAAQPAAVRNKEKVLLLSSRGNTYR